MGKKKDLYTMRRTIIYILLLLMSVGLRAQEILPYPMDTIKGKVYYKYTVEKSIGLYRISKNFGVTQEAILDANPVLRTRGLRYEEVILIPTDLPAIPKKAEEPKEEKTKLEEPKEDIKPKKELPKPKAEIAHPKVELPKPEAQTAQPAAKAEQTEMAIAQPMVEEPADTLVEMIVVEDVVDSLLEAEEIVYTDTMRIAYLLPLQAEIAHRNTTIDRFYDFYAGSLLALKHYDATYRDSLGQKHTTYYEVHTHDVDKLGGPVCELRDSGVLANMNAIVGPAYLNPATVLDEYVEEHHIPMIIPFLPQLTSGRMSQNPYILKFNPSEHIQIHALMEHLDTLRSSINIVLVDAYADKMDYSSEIRSLRDSIVARGLPATRITIRQILADSVGVALKDSVNNLLLFHSDRYSNIQLLMPYLLSGKRSKQLTILSHYAWQGERILLPQLYTSVFQQPEGEAYTRYEEDFANYFGHTLSSTHPRYDLLGYDLTNYVLESLKAGEFHIADSIYQGIQSSILFTPNEHGGYENTHIVILEH